MILSFQSFLHSTKNMDSSAQLIPLNGEQNVIGGYDFEFLDDLYSGYCCPICLVVMRNPVQTTCGHRFCKECLLGTFRYPCYFAHLAHLTARVHYSTCVIGVSKGFLRFSFASMDEIKACSKRRATAVPNSNEFGLAVARRWHSAASVSNVEPNTVAPNSKDQTNHPSSVIVCK